MKVWLKLWPQIKAYRKDLILVLILGVVTSGFKLAIPPLTNLLFTAWQNHTETREIWLLPVGLGLMWIVSCVARYFHIYIMKFTAEKISVNQRRQLMDKYLSLNLSFFQEIERGTGGLISRMLNDIVIIREGLDKIADVLREPLLIVGLLSYMVYLDWKLTLFLVVAAPFVIAVLRNLARSIRKYAHQSQESLEDLTRTLKESLDGTRVVQSFLLEGEMHRKFNAQADLYLQTRREIVAREELGSPVSESLMAIFLIGLFEFVNFQIFHSHLTVATFMTFIFAMGLLQDSFRRLQSAYIRVQQAGAGMERLENILQSQPNVMDPDEPLPFPENWQKIEFRNVTFSYGDEPILKRLNLTIHRSEIVAIVGSSGSGKSTLANLAQRFFDPQEGEILIDDAPISRIRLSDLRRHIALVTQDVFLFNDSIERNIQLGNLEKGSAEVREAARLANADAFIQQTPFGYQTSVGDFGSRISGGEKQRISIARAILKDAPILILDEATSALDSESEKEVQKGLNQLLEGRTAIVIAHRLSTIAKATRIIVLKKGEIVEEGNHDQLLARRGEYFKFHEMQYS